MRFLSMEIAFPLKENKLTNEKKTEENRRHLKTLCEIRGQMAGYKRCNTIEGNNSEQLNDKAEFKKITVIFRR